MTALISMSKPRKPPEDKVPSYPATPAYKQWVWNQIRKRDWTQQDLVDAIKKADRAQTGGVLTATISTGWLTQFLGPEDAPRRFFSNTEMMPAMNKALGIAQPPICDPSDELAVLVDRFRERWKRATPRERAILVAALGDDDDEIPVDSDSKGVSRGSRRVG